MATPILPNVTSYTTLAALEAASPPDGTMAVVYADPTPANNRSYVRQGGAWVTDYDPLAYALGNRFGFQQAGSGAVLRTFQSKMRDTVSVFDFGAIGDGITDDTLSLNSFFAWCSANHAAQAEVNGTFAISGQVTVGPSTGIGATLKYHGVMTLIAIGPIAQMCVVQSMPFAVWNGGIKCIGTGASSLASRGCQIGVRFIASLRMEIDFIYCQYFSYAGVLAVDATNNTMVNIINCVCYDCGSGVTNTYITGASLSANWTAPANSGSSGSNAQSTVIAVDQLPPTYIFDGTYNSAGEKPFMVRINGFPYYVQSVDSANSKLTVFPWVDSTISSGALEYIWGGGIVLSGANTNVWGLGACDLQRCGIGLVSAASYGARATRVVMQYCGTGIAVGNSLAATTIGNTFHNCYFEGNSENLLMIALSGTNTYGGMDSEYALDLSKVFVCAPRLADNTISSTSGGLSNFRLSYQGQLLQYEKRSSNATETGTIIFSIDRRDKRLVLRLNSGTINLDAMNTDLNRLFGYDSGEILLWGTGSGNAPAGAITFDAPVGATVNGSSTATFSGFTAPAKFLVYWQASANNFMVSTM